MKKLTRKSLDELARVMPVIDESKQKSFVGGKNGDTLAISGGILLEWNGGTYFISEDENSCCITYYSGVTFSTGTVAKDAAYQLNGVIHISSSWASGGFNNDDFAHEYGHYIQQMGMGDRDYWKNVVLKSVWSAATDSGNHSEQDYEVDATQKGSAYQVSGTNCF